MERSKLTTPPSATTELDTMNEGADSWRHDIGMNVIPAASKDKQPIVLWKECQDKPIPQEQHEKWKDEGAFKDGIAVILGRVWHNKEKQGYYLNCIDIDNAIALQELLTRNGRTIELQELAKRTIVEQHSDQPERAHVYIYTVEKPLRDKDSDAGKPGLDHNSVPAFEVKASSKKLSFPSPSIHKNGYRVEILGTQEVMILGDVETVEFQEHLDNICKKYGLKYNGHGDSNTKTPITDLFKDDTIIYESHNRHEALLRAMESLIQRTRGVLSQEQILDLAKEWNQKHCVPPLDNKEFNRQWKSALDFIAKNGSTTTTNDNSAHTTEYQERLQETNNNERKVSSNDIQFVLNTMKKEAPYDLTSIKQLFYGMCSAFTKLPMHHEVNSIKAGAGKTYDLVLVSSYFPKKYVLSFVGISDKALMHEPGIDVMLDEDTNNTIPIAPTINEKKTRIKELKKQLRKSNLGQDQKNELKDQIDTIVDEIKELKDNSQKLIILDNRIILLLDTAQEGLYNTLMSLISQDTGDDQLYQFAEKKTSGKMGSPKNRLRGTPAMFTAQVVDDTRQARYGEKNRRFIHVVPDTSSNKIKSAISLIGRKYGLLPEEYDDQVVSKRDKEIAKVIIDTIVEKLKDHSKLFEPKDSGVRIPFTASIAQGIIADPNDVWSMTVMDRLMRYLIVIAKVNMDSRPRIVDTETGRFYPIATFADLKEALELMAMAASTLRPYIADWYNKVFLPTFEDNKDKPYELRSENGYLVASEIRPGINTDQLSEATQRIMGTGKLGSETILKTYLYPLLNLGYIDKVPSNIDRRSNIYFPVKEGNIASTFKNENDPRLEVPKEYYPSKNVLEEDFRTFVKYYSKGGIKYTIFDTNGSEIQSVDELIDRYLGDPETCFIAKDDE